MPGPRVRKSSTKQALSQRLTKQTGWFMALELFSMVFPGSSDQFPSWTHCSIQPFHFTPPGMPCLGGSVL